jgi:hypothetical protein
MAALRRGSEDLLGIADTQLPWWVADAADLCLDSFWTYGCDSCMLALGGMLWRWEGPSSPLLPAGGVGATGLDRVMAVVLGFLSRQDEELSGACLH